MSKTPIQKLVAIAGGPGRLASLLGISTPAVSKWREVPSERVIACCGAVGWAITPHELRPDLYPNPDDALPVEPSPNPNPRPASGSVAKSAKSPAAAPAPDGAGTTGIEAARFQVPL